MYAIFFYLLNINILSAFIDCFIYIFSCGTIKYDDLINLINRVYK